MPTAAATLDALTGAGALRRRPTGWYWARDGRPDVDLRGTGGAPISIVEASTGRLLGTVDGGASHGQVHAGAVHLHQGVSYVVDRLDLDDRVALVHAEEPDWSTHARDVTSLTVESVTSYVDAGPVGLFLGTVDVTNQVVSYQRRRLATGEVIDTRPLDLPARATADDRRLVDHLAERAGAGRRRAGRRPGRAARRRARRDRPAAAGRDLRPVGHRRPVHGAAPGHRGADRLRLRRASGRRRIRRAGLPRRGRAG